MSNVLLEANELVNGARAKTYGRPKENWERTAKIASALIGLELTAEQCVKVAIAMKFARLMQTPDHHDSLVDVPGYMWVLADVVEGGQE